MNICYTHQTGITATIPKDDDLAKFAVASYGCCLNTPERINRTHDAKAFAEAITENFDTNQPVTAAVIQHLNSLA